MRFNTRIFALGLAGLLSALLIGAVGWTGQQRLHDASQSQWRASEALRQTMEADMMHDALRADVLMALRAASQRDAAGIEAARHDIEEHGARFSEALDGAAAAAPNAEVAAAIAAARPVLDRYREEALQLATLAGKNPAAAAKRMAEFQKVFHELEVSNEALSEQVSAATATESARMAAVAASTRRWQLLSLILIGAGMLMLCTLTVRFVARRLGADPEEAVKVARRIAAGDLDTTLSVTPRPRSLLHAMFDMQRQLRTRRDSEARQAEENRTILQALDSSSTGLLVVDTAGCVQHVNNTAQQILLKAESALREHIPGFSASQTTGVALAQLHVGLRETTDGNLLSLGEQTLRVSQQEVLNAEGQVCGSIVEWRDRTAEHAVEAEIAQIIEAASEGDLSRRIAVDGLRGFLRRLGLAVNRILDANASGVDEIRRVLSALAQADLTAQMRDDLSGAFAETRQHMNIALEQLISTMEHIRVGAGSVQTAASEIAAGNQDLASRTEAQAANLEQTAASIEQLTSTVKQTASSARNANELAIAAGQSASRGRTAVDDAITTMNEISEAANHILDIISVIDGIAFQTNILALNASVEAARAGEQGRSFAVVAGEVRLLAGRSAKAAQEIKRLIGTTTDKVSRGRQTVNEAGERMTDITSSVGKVITVISDIAMAAEEQSHGIEQINIAVTHMDETTRQNAALVEEASAAAQMLDEQAVALRTSVDKFRLPGSAANEGASARTAAEPAAAEPAAEPVVDAESSPAVATPLPKKPMPRRRAPRATKGAALLATDSGIDGRWQAF